jgi:hypothetical protein
VLTHHINGATIVEVYVFQLNVPMLFYLKICSFALYTSTNDENLSRFFHHHFKFQLENC